MLAKFPSPAPPRPQTPGFPPRDSTRAVDRVVTEKQPQGGVHLPSGRGLGRLALSQACLARSSGRQRAATALPVRLGGRPSADKSPKRGVGKREGSAEKRQAGASEWKVWKSFQKASRRAELEEDAGSERLGTDSRLPLTRPPCWGVGAAGARGLRPSTGHLTWQLGAEPRSCKSRERRRATFSLLSAPFPLYLRRRHSSRGRGKLSGSTWPGGALSRPVASYKVKLRRLMHMRRAAVTACPICSCSPRPGNEPLGGSPLGPGPQGHCPAGAAPP